MTRAHAWSWPPSSRCPAHRRELGHRRLDAAKHGGASTPEASLACHLLSRLSLLTCFIPLGAEGADTGQPHPRELVARKRVCSGTTAMEQWGSAALTPTAPSRAPGREVGAVQLGAWDGQPSGRGNLRSAPPHPPCPPGPFCGTRAEPSPRESGPLCPVSSPELGMRHRQGRRRKSVKMSSPSSSTLASTPVPSYLICSDFVFVSTR